MEQAAEERRVLIVDDDPMVRQMIVAHAESADFEVRDTGDPREFLKMQREWRPHFVVIDLVMGDMDGLDVLRGLAKAGSEAAVVIASGVGARVLDAAHRLADEQGLTLAGVISKPFKRAELVALLNAQSERHEPATAAGGRASEWSSAEFSAEFHAALRRGHLSVMYQPKLACSTGAVVGYEALSRWNHDTLGPIPPDVFVPMAERTGLIHDLTSFMMRESLAWFAGLDAPPEVSLAINIAAVELAEPKLDARLLAACRTAGVETSRLIVEVTETSAMEDPVKSLEMLTRLRLVGFHVSLDDFGTGYSTVQQLARMPFTEVKIDRSFVSAITKSHDSHVLVATMVSMSHGLGLECTAEGVEDVETLRALNEVGCDHAQGYVLARPMTAEQIADWEPPVDVLAEVRKGA